MQRHVLSCGVPSFLHARGIIGSYESGKALVPAGHGMLGDMAVGVWAQLVAGVVYTPIDIVKERLQVRPVWWHIWTCCCVCSMAAREQARCSQLERA